MKFKISIAESTEREVVLELPHDNFDGAWEEIAEWSDSELIERLDAGEQRDLRVLDRQLIGVVEAPDG